MSNKEEKTWGSREFWGVGFQFDPQWVLTDQQKIIQKNLIDLCRTTLRPNAVRYDKTYEFPRESLNALASQGLLGLMVPKELGGLGENHMCAAMVVESIARYGCPSTAMVYVMHLSTVSALVSRHHRNDHFKDLLRRLDKDKMVGTLGFSDPATGEIMADPGSHLWYFLSSKCWELADGRFQVHKNVSWATSAGFADFYIFTIVSPDHGGDYQNFSFFLMYKDEVRANTEDWAALGMHGNQSGPMTVEGVFTRERLIGKIGDGSWGGFESTNPIALILFAATNNGISMGAIDITRKHTLSRTHADTGMRVCDYPIIQDKIGQAMCDTSAARFNVFAIAQQMDRVTNNCDWSKYEDPSYLPRAELTPWVYQAKVFSCKNVFKIVDKMLQACGGSGYKTELGLERLLRDGKAGWLMGPSNEIMVQVIASLVLHGTDKFDYWNNKPNARIVRQEVKKMTVEQKKELAKHLLWEVEAEKAAAGQTDVDKFDFDNPLAVRKPTVVETRKNALQIDAPSSFTLKEKCILTKDGRMAVYTFTMPPGTSHTGCLPGQYIQIVIPDNGRESVRFLSPTSSPDADGKLEIVLRHENKGVLTKFMQQLEIGGTAQFKGPCGGFEYTRNTFDSLTFICTGIGIAPAYQIIRSISEDQGDKTKILLLYQAKDSNDMIFKKELEAICSARADQQIRAEFIVNDPDEAWDGLVGDVDSVLLQKYFNVLPSKKTCQAFVLCGGEYMVVRCLDTFHQLQVKSEDIFIYGSFAAEQIRSMFGRSAKLFLNKACP